MGWFGYKGLCGILALILLLFSRFTETRAGMAPVLLGGELFYSARKLDSQQGSSSSGNQYGLVLNMRSFIIQPWIARWDARLNFVTNTISGDNQRSDSDVITGEFNLNLFPRSHFPADVFASWSDSRVDSEDGYSFDTKTQRFGVAQRFRDKRSGLQLQGRIEQLNVSSINGADSGRSISMGASYTYGVHRLSASLQKVTVERRPSAEFPGVLQPDTKELTLTADHGAPLGDGVSMTNRVDYIKRSSDSVEGIRQNFNGVQYNGYLTLTPVTRPRLRVTGSARVQQTDRDFASVSDQSTTADIVAGVTYDKSDHTRLRGSLGITQVAQDSGSDESRYLASAGLIYQPEPVKVGVFDYSWSVSPGIRVNRDGTGSSQEISVGAGHGLSRQFYGFEQSSISLRMNQSGLLSRGEDTTSRGEEDDPGESDFRLSHSLGLNWSRRAGRSNFSAGLNLSDSREYNKTDKSYSIGSLYFNGNHSFSRNSHLSGNIRYQKTFSNFSDDPDNRRASTSASLRQTVDRVFGVPRLRFRSDLLIRQSQSDTGRAELDQLLLEKKRADAEWRNRLDYRIGRLDLSFSVDVAKSDDRTTRAVRGKISRRFGR